VWNRQRTDRDLVDPGDVALGHKEVQRWNLPDGWVISKKPVHEALVSEADFITIQGVHAARVQAPEGDITGPGRRRYLLAGLLACGTCGRRMESAWSSNRPAYRCRHGHTTASTLDVGGAKNAYIREDAIFPHLPALHLLLTGTSPGRRRRRTCSGADVSLPVTAEDVTGTCAHQLTLTYDPASGTLQAGTRPGRPVHHPDSTLTKRREPR
jgi:site-specific DNA recombinase